MIIDCEHHPELIHPTVFIAPGAVILGQVTIGERSSIWYGAVLRGDLAPIVIGQETSVQDGCLIHVRIEYPCYIGNRVTLGHRAVLHGCTIEDEVLVGIQATILDGAVIGAGSIVGAGAVVSPGTVIPPGSLVLGIPAKVVGIVSERQRQQVQESIEHYIEAARVYKAAASGQ